MTTTAAATLAEVEMLRHQTKMTNMVFQANTNGLTQEESLIQPHPGGNCLNWVVGHLVCIYNNILPLLGQEQVRNDLQRYDRGTPPIQDPAEAKDFGELMAAWNETVQRFDAGLANLTPEVLDRESPIGPEPGRTETVRSLLSIICFHQAYHAGQTGVLRRLAGKEGAIR
ncbi:MAG TPA: DinB family protein [Thermoanaerobaculia bacterium]|nr:DinB family protein [Thermoanaerobaculia bacterium]